MLGAASPWIPLLLFPAARPQEAAAPQRITAPLEHRGTFQVSSGTWLPGGPGASSAAFTSDVLYNNSAPSGYAFFPGPGRQVVDHGRIPSPTSPTSQRSVTGTRPQYTIDCFSIAYCSAVTAGGCKSERRSSTPTCPARTSI